ncbi:hypothetical protein NQ318_000133 [Aromia moschata]|uniref:Uncharacterized protein n=1 Tax=Aromia moschata TaxID=1265417 RepID=A0AAV8XIH9_9CUCU|nr:hypothetical protein NQ318_000133 [Aromia moschata]
MREYGDMQRSQDQVCALLNALYPNRSVKNQSTREELRPYKLQLVHELNEDGFNREIEFCEGTMERFNNNN